METIIIELEITSCELEIFPEARAEIINNELEKIQDQTDYFEYIKTCEKSARVHDAVIKITGEVQETFLPSEIDFIVIFDNKGGLVIEYFGFTNSYREMYVDLPNARFAEIYFEDVISMIKDTDELDSSEIQELLEEVNFALGDTEVWTINKERDNNYVARYLTECYRFQEEINLDAENIIDELEKFIENWGPSVEEVAYKQMEEIEKAYLEEINFNFDQNISNFYKG